VEAIARLNRAGMTVILVSNQRGIALGLFTHDQLELIHKNMRAHLAQHGALLDAIYYCPHDIGECQCRKPDIGLFEQAYRDFPEASADNGVVIGDSLSDIQAGQRLRMKTIFIQGEADRQKAGAAAAAESADAIADSLLQAVELLV
jgi:D-glycero-D-manno-heptose 1,7-bisphosphate phosphatase